MSTRPRGGLPRSAGRYATNPLHSTVSSKLNRERLRQSLSIEALATKAGVSTVAVLNVLHCHTDAGVQTIALLAQALGLPLGWVLTDDTTEFGKLFCGADEMVQASIICLLSPGDAFPPPH